ncbi:hypothetical protein WJS89_06250 [Sphingomicrobium sp. XHP0235]|uniref:hypothetical protein n=1 Tax=Sphingomicrobium aquimarinum TaxID=3133971 RepID=UPI0031FEEDB3
MTNSKMKSLTLAIALLGALGACSTADIGKAVDTWERATAPTSGSDQSDGEEDSDG